MLSKCSAPRRNSNVGVSASKDRCVTRGSSSQPAETSRGAVAGPSSVDAQGAAVQALLQPTYASRFMSSDVPKFTLPEESMPASIAAQIIRDEMTLDGSPGLNLATFVNTYMDREANKLLAEQMRKNMIDADEYPMTAEIQDRCVRILGDIYHAPPEAVGTACVGSSEGCLLGGFAMKIRWREQRRSAGKPFDKPNLVLSTAVQIVWKKFLVLADVEPRYISMKPGKYTMQPDEVLAAVDENTIGVVTLFASTLTGEYDPIAEIASALERKNAETGWGIGIHIDAASGGFVAPFVQQHIRWDFQLPLVRSINVSAHKYGLVYPGIGFVLWRDAQYLPEDMVFHINYLGSDESTIGLNFSRGSGGLIGMYYNFLALGRSGYQDIMTALMQTHQLVRDGLVATGHFENVPTREGVPVVCVRLSKEQDRGYTVFDVSERLREHGWIVPAYTLAAQVTDIAVLRIVVREGLSRDLAEKLLDDIDCVIQKLDREIGGRIRRGEAARC